MRILFLFVGEKHHVFHALPIAGEMAARYPDLDIEIAIAGPENDALVRDVLNCFPGFTPTIRYLDLPGPADALHKWGVLRGQQRITRLIAALPYLRGFDAIVVPERTTTMIRHFLGSRTKLIFTPHGAGDRAITYDKRDRLFDFALVAGEKSERRMLELGTIRPGAYAVTGYVKMDFMQRLAAHRPPLFDNGRPTVLYAPHFRSSLSSWDRFGKAIIRAFAAQDRYNLVVAPHIRLFDHAPARVTAPIEAMAVPGKIIVDLSSERLVDMTYTAGADIYLGDVSSQVYEFLNRPRPCVFLNAHDADWPDNPDYLFWTLGDVVSSVADVLPAIDAAAERHPLYAARQCQILSDSIGGDPTGASARSADAILHFLEEKAKAGRKAASR
ncbi:MULTISPECIES: hypothetical protein [Sphingomonadales]|uniref:CDP-Glycerol:Poly(Glycerophosphate) glycerophosphotransferase n=1 Tax=Edaphosphingomonas haloaromaticamans TaxID=653954 RepID=A0A1S1HC57_9SPHN|nr:MULTISPECIES: hypothetical protein [Sphingomonas]AGH51231.1 hypothetical protein G432_17565 [Sphingomonas sp. MM-1]OHT19764.1 hypothetical protein BHE75_01753 [Sphingomonas haloaromaticamans]